NAMKRYTPRQLELMFPNGLADALKNVADVARHLFPATGKGDMAAGLAAGAVKAALPLGLVHGAAGVTGQTAIGVYGWSLFWNWLLSKPRVVLLFSQGLGTPGPARQLTIQTMQWAVRAAGLGVLGMNNVGAPVYIPEPGEGDQGQ